MIKHLETLQKGDMMKELHFSWNFIIGILLVFIGSYLFTFDNILVVFGLFAFIFAIGMFVVGYEKVVV